MGGLRHLTVRAYEVRITDPELRQQFDALKVQLDRAVVVRNDYVHARYVFGFKSGIQHTCRPRSGPVVEKTRMVQLADLEAAIDLVASAELAVIDLHDATVSHLPPRSFEPRGGAVLPDGTYMPGQMRWSIAT